MSHAKRIAVLNLLFDLSPVNNFKVDIKHVYVCPWFHNKLHYTPLIFLTIVVIVLFFKVLIIQSMRGHVWIN